MSKEKLYRHGEIILKRVQEIPLKAKVSNNFVLAEGKTGHKHLLSGKSVQVLEFGDKKFINAKSEAKISHDEHKAITLPKGLYEVVIQREYDPVAERKVQD